MPPIIYRSGETAGSSGLYKTIHYRTHPPGAQPADDMQRFVAGEIFPSCVVCENDIAYLLIRDAPHIFEDPDFASLRQDPDPEQVKASEYPGSPPHGMHSVKKDHDKQGRK